MPSLNTHSHQLIDSLVRELKEIYEKDQRYRLLLVNEKKNMQAEERKKYFLLMKKTEEDNLSRVLEIIKRYGWPKRKLLGEDAAKALFLVIQHCDNIKVQEQCLKLLKNESNISKANLVDMAYLEDSVAVTRGMKQIYGTQITYQSGRPELYPVEDEQNVNTRRREIGLPPLSEYLKNWNIEY